MKGQYHGSIQCCMWLLFLDDDDDDDEYGEYDDGGHLSLARACGIVASLQLLWMSNHATLWKRGFKRHANLE
eukprot:24360-Amphidinium_carterae.1